MLCPVCRTPWLVQTRSSVDVSSLQLSVVCVLYHVADIAVYSVAVSRHIVGLCRPCVHVNVVNGGVRIPSPFVSYRKIVQV